MEHTHGFPAPRARPRAWAPVTHETFHRYETNGETTLGDTDAEVWTFSGRPDSITISARAFPALVTLTDRLSRTESTILVQVGAPLDTRISRERVIARNAIAGSNAVLNVVGKWVALDVDEPNPGHRAAEEPAPATG